MGRQISIRDQLHTSFRQCFASRGRCQCLQFNRAGSTQARADACQFRVLVSGMAYQFPSTFRQAFRNSANDRGEQRFIKSARFNDSQTPVRGDHAVFCNEIAERRKRPPQCPDLKIALPQRWPSAEFVKRQGSHGHEWISHSPYPAGSRRFQQRSQDGREDMRVLVRVKVTERDPGTLELTKLRRCFRLDLLFRKSAHAHSLDKASQRWCKGGSVFRKSQRRNFPFRQHRHSVDQYHVTAEAESGRNERNCFLQLRSGCH